MATASLVQPQRSLSAAPLQPDWYRDAIFYEVSVKAFYDSNHDGIGDFPGLTRKLDYVQDLGVTALWLMPFYPSPWRDDGYDIADYRGVHPSLGTMQDVQKLLEEAHRRKLRVVADLVINHTSDQHPWFQAARAAPADSPLRSFYVWETAPPQRSAGRRPGAGWTYDAQADAYYWHQFSPHEPDLNYDNPAVVSEMGKVLRFWLEQGFDGLSLGGAAHLVDRPLSAGGELPATHAVLRALRREADGYGDRLIVAGVNAWPDEAATYCGAADEAQMVPLLPLAQRLFQALQQEHRHAIVDLLRQTPELPERCQWLTLLRNHDELTLELATDEERDYLFHQYAADERMRRRGGILRRLAPLLDNSRGKLELMLGLLFSLPGSPLICYGDEIGMGDNVYLRDRSGLRTPMQWSADRNAGFSRGDFARLYEPPVLDPIYGYQAVNVEAQRRDTSSLWHWLRRLMGLRKRLPALSRGSVEILEPANRKVLALTRRLGDQTVLAVGNLSRSLQPVILDLSAYSGLTPIEAFGRSVLPPIGDDGYFLTLGPHAFHWFVLEQDHQEVAQRLGPVPVEPVKQLPTIELAGNAEALFQGGALEQLEQQVLPAYLKSQRWFGGKARQIDAVQVTHWQRLLADPAPAFLMLLEVRFAGGQRDLYFVPIALRADFRSADLPVPLRRFAIAEFTCPSGRGLVLDALADDDACFALLEAVTDARQLDVDGAQIRGIPTQACSRLLGEITGRLPLVRAGATSSNSLILFGQRLLMKLFRRLQPGINPDVEIGRYFTDKHAFRSTPPLAGTLELTPAGQPPLTLAIFQAVITNQGDGWEHVIAELEHYFERASGRMQGPDPLILDKRPLMELASSDPPPIAVEAIGSYLHAAATLGRRTAEMHLSLAAEQVDPAFAAEALSAADLQGLADDIHEQGQQARSAMETNLGRLPEETSAAARRFLEQAPTVIQRLQSERSPAAGARKIRCHGDYHLGQVLWVDNDYVLLDFEGEPARTLEERRAKQSPLKDVAGMLRSYSYAAYAGLFNYTQSHPDDFTMLQPWAELWRQWVSATFVKSYLATLGDVELLPRERPELTQLLGLFLLDKALYELVYELNNRPDWVRIPLAGILELFAQQPENETSHDDRIHT